MARVLPAIVSQHADEAAFLWGVRDAAVAAANYGLRDLADLEGRLDAHLEGLRVAGAEGRRICAEELDPIEAGAAFVRSLLALEAGDELDVIVAALSAEPASLRGLAAAFAWAGAECSLPSLRASLESEVAAVRRAALSACGGLRADPGPGLDRALDDPTPAVRARALRAIGELGDRTRLAAVGRSVADDSFDVAAWATWSTVLLGGEPSPEQLERLLGSASECPPVVLETLVRARPAAAPRSIVGLDAAALRRAIDTAAHIGDSAAIGELIELLTDPRLARAAGQAIVTITGVDPQDARIEGEPPDGFSAGPNEDPDDVDVALDPDEDLPWLDPAATAAWWRREASDFAPGRRLLWGRPLEEPHLRRVLVAGRQPQRASAALELRLRDPGHPLFATRARAVLQRAALGLSSDASGAGRVAQPTAVS